TDYLGLVHGEVVSGANVLRDMMATVTDFVGGRSAAYEEELTHSREAALVALSDRAQRMGADAVVGLELDYEVVGGRGAMIMVTAIGTAVRLRKP
ncbi:MAG: YbjQ family protein, partial [Devosia sp.]